MRPQCVADLTNVTSFETFVIHDTETSFNCRNLSFVPIFDGTAWAWCSPPFMMYITIILPLMCKQVSVGAKRHHKVLLHHMDCSKNSSNLIRNKTQSLLKDKEWQLHINSHVLVIAIPCGTWPSSVLIVLSWQRKTTSTEYTIVFWGEPSKQENSFFRLGMASNLQSLDWGCKYIYLVIAHLPSALCSLPPCTSNRRHGCKGGQRWSCTLLQER